MTFKAWIKTITFYELIVGMKATMSHLLHYKPITLQYPHEKRTLPDNYRGMLSLLRYDDGTEKCVGCDLCEAACPSRVIRVVSAEVPSEPTNPLHRQSSAPECLDDGGFNESYEGNDSAIVDRFHRSDHGTLSH